MITLSGRRYLVTGVLTSDSLAWHIARALQLADAQVLLTGYGRTRRITELAAAELPRPAEVLALDATRRDDFTALGASVADRWPALDGAVHAIAGAPADAIGGSFLTTAPDSAERALRTSALSLHALTTALAPLLERGADGGSVVGLDFDGTLAWPGYDWMGVAKAALESVCRYLALYLGPRHIRVNLVATGPVETVSGRGVATFGALDERWRGEAPLGWDSSTAAAEVVAGPVLFLLSPLARGITGEVIHADGGMRHTGMGLPAAPMDANRTTNVAHRTTNVAHPTTDAAHPTTDAAHPTADAADLTADVLGRS
ncbi:SDR family oxidoreductase [Streptomyces sp. S465]|uniref:SDR family oxidoreductase n=1 Tax=Streptomyces sp. S465 TaxID=2979468 RepID=UPI0022A85D32|nr:SDR family oxidoreductase [Streptomyces sp. S465]WAP54873.1 SDR family oxidoreductase [Streptomyces sp. S465]